VSDPIRPADFAAHLARWRTWAASPWGRIRFAVVRRTISWQVAALGGGPLRILDVGGGDARDLLPLARDGHDVTVLDTSPGMLDEARARARRHGVGDRLHVASGSVEDLADSVGGGFDLVLCHFLLHYRQAGTDDLRALSAALRPRGRLSVIAPNPAGAVLARLVREGPAAAAEELHRRESESATFGQAVRKIDCDEMARDMATAGLEVVARYGGRCANDLLVDDEAKHDAEYFLELERLELELCDREPYKRLGQFWQLVGERRSP
jgi:S-adenosylmethionine-dependent methyltransferase